MLRPGGLALITTNGAGHIAELKAVMDDAARWVAGTGVDPDWDMRRFDTDTAKAMLAEVFDEVTVVPAGGSSVVTEAAPIVDYLASWPPSAVGLEDGPMWTEVLREATRTVLAHFAQSPTFHGDQCRRHLWSARVPAVTVTPTPPRGPMRQEPTAS